MTPEGWTRALVGAIAAPHARSIAIGPFGSSLKSEVYADHGMPVIRGQNIAGGRQIDDSDLVFVPEVVAQSFPACIVREGDLVFPHRGAIGRVAIVGEREYLLSSSMMKLTCNPELVDPTYVFYYFRGPGQRELLTRASTVGTPGIGQPLKSLRGIRIDFPSLGQQRAIAAVLGALDDKIAANTKLAETAAALASALFIQARSDSVGERLLSNLVTTQYGVTTSAADGAGPRLLRVTDINKNPWIEWQGAPGCVIDAVQKEKYGLQAGDILVARMADPGKAAYIDQGDPDAVFASYLVRLKTLDPEMSLYVYYFIRSREYQEYAEAASTGSVQRNMNARVIVGPQIPLPPQAVIQRFNGEVASLRSVLSSHLRENARLVDIRDALLPLLMSGKIRVRDAERVVEGVV